MKTSTIILILAGVYAYTKYKGSSTTGGLTTDAMKQQLVTFAANYPDASIFLTAIYQMTAAEITSTWQYIFNYWTKNITLQPGTALYDQIMAISTKYNIFN